MRGKNLVNQFAKSRDGNFAMMFAFATLPMIASVAMLVEYSNMSKAQQELQSAVDATALMVGKDFNSTGIIPSEEQLKNLVETNFDGEITSVQASVIGGELHFVTKTDTKALFGRVLGTNFEQSASTTVPLKTGGMGFEIALVLDSTGSMDDDNKMVDLKVVAKNFVDDIFAKSDEKGFTTSISIVPFAQYVNVGRTNVHETWLQLVDSSDNLVNSGTFNNNGINTAVGGENWYGCTGSRPLPLNTKDGSYSTPVPGLLGISCPTEITALTDKKSTLKNAINALNPSGYTYIGGGVMWGLRTLTPLAPFEEGLPSSENVRKALIVMSDGDNTRGPDGSGSAWHKNGDQTFIDGQTLDACAQANLHGLKVYSISFGTDVSATGKAVLRDCATKAENFYDASDADKLKKAFDAIAEDIYRLKLSS